ncbi:hypothetical protein ACFOET_06860 [Parapedobacter deserti]|uniref:Uncharacterized protein n=1 Tax=Parapedobacter deserti TaxID=1912957 RepID=A0ABV7JJH0_9SPHI
MGHYRPEGSYNAVILNSPTAYAHLHTSLRSGSVPACGSIACPALRGTCILGNLPFPKPLGTLQAPEYAPRGHRTYRSPFRHRKVCLPAPDVVRGSGRSSVRPPGAVEGRPVKGTWNKAE